MLPKCSLDIPLQGRSHDNFLCKLSEHLESRPAFLDGLAACLHTAGFETETATLEEASAHVGGNYIKSTQLVDLKPFL
jgi:hypothetical protein